MNKVSAMNGMKQNTIKEIHQGGMGSTLVMESSEEAPVIVNVKLETWTMGRS
jgi:hypothetical protein